MPCRVYAPVGSHEDLLPTSCGGCWRTARTPRSSTASSTSCRSTRSSPTRCAGARGARAGGRIRGSRCRATLFQPERPNSARLEPGRPVRAGAAREAMRARADPGSARGRSSAGKDADRRRRRPSTQPADRRVVGRCVEDDRPGARRRARIAPAQRRAGTDAGADERAAMCLERAADLFERTGELMALCVREAGKTVPDASPRCARRWISCATTRCPARERLRRAAALPGRPARATSSRCTAAACSPASARGTSRWRSSPARWRRRWPPATRCSPSRPSRRR
jgi:hypothetical protein